MILSLIGIHSIKAPLICPCTHRDGYSFLLYLIISYVHHLLSTLQCYWSVPFHLVSLIPSTSIPYSFISLATCPARVVPCHGPHVPATNDRLSLGSYYGAYGPLGFLAGFEPRASLQPQQQPPQAVLSHYQHLVSVTVSVFMEQGRYTQPLTWRTRG